MPFSDRLVAIATFDTVMEATIARNRLEAEGVRAFLADSTTVEMAWHLTGAIGGIKLQVMEDDADHAISVLQTDDDPPISDEEWRSDEANEDFGPEVDNAYEDEFVSPIDELVNSAFRAAIFGLIWLPLQFYSFWLLGRIFFGGVALTSANRRRMLITFMLNLWVILLFVVLLWVTFPR